MKTYTEVNTYCTILSDIPMHLVPKMITLVATTCILLWSATCVKSPPYPESEVIKRVSFAPVSSIIQKAVGSDNWPITWAEDDNLYTAWGDGRGFEPYTAKKLSLGMACIMGDPNRFYGVNLPSPSDSTEPGKFGPKASGLLSLNGILYMWVRNTGNATLVWSPDHSKTWHWGFRFHTSFGCPTFLNFGKKYQGASDDYVYIYSQDGPSAYESYDQIVLARVPRSNVTDQSDYQFFQGVDMNGNPLWTSDINRRGPVFEYPGHCQRIEVVYNPGIKRYLMVLGYNHKGGWGIFDAPEPWGPWTTVFHTEKWDIPGTHGYRFPTKWIQNGGQTMHLVFSGVSAKGYDAFCVRKMFLTLLPHDVSGK